MVNLYYYHCVVIHVYMVIIYCQRGDWVKLYHTESAWDITTGNQLGLNRIYTAEGELERRVRAWSVERQEKMDCLGTCDKSSVWTVFK